MVRIDRSVLRRIGCAVPAMTLAVVLTAAAAVAERSSDGAADLFAGTGIRHIADERAPLADAPSAAEEAAAAEREMDAEELGYVPDQIVVVYEEDATRRERREAVEELGAEELGRAVEVAEGTVASLDIPDEMTVDDAVQAAQASSAVKYALPNYVAETFDEVGTATAFTTASGNERLDDQWHLGFVKAPGAWEALASCEEPTEPVKVAVIDTGASLSHPDLASVVDWKHSIEVVWTDKTSLASWQGRPLRGDGYTNGSSRPTEYTSHGTHVTGILGAQAGNGGVLGVASGAGTTCANELVDVMVIDAFSLLDSNGRPNATLQDIVYALEHARTNGCRVVNMSLGFVSDDPELAQFFEGVCRGLADADDMLLVCAAGNSNARTKNYPAACSATLSIISISERSGVGEDAATFVRPFWHGSDVLRSSFSNYGSWCDVSAPGERILSTFVRNGSTNGYATMSGTSMASPVAAGVAAMVRAAHPALTAAEVKELLCATAVDLYTAGRDDQTGYGAVDAEAAVKRALALRRGTYEEEDVSPEIAPETVPADGAPAPEKKPAAEPRPSTPTTPPAPNPATKQPEQSSGSQGAGSPAPTKPNTSAQSTKKPAAKEPAAQASPAQTKPTVRKVAAPKLKKAKRGFTVTWRKVSGNVTGYQVQYALDKKFKKAVKTKTLSKGKKTWKATKLKAKKRYYVRVRAYYKAEGKKYYGKWSSVKSVVTKK